MKELWAEFAAAQTRRRDEHERDTTLAWQVNRIYVQTANKKRLPSLASLLPNETAQKVNWKPSLEQQRAQLEDISRKYRIPMTVIPAA